MKAARLLAREHNRIANIRRSFLHEVSSQLAKTHSGLAVEDLPVANLIRNKRFAQAITDAGWAELARQLRYKTAWLGGELVVCDRWFPSTKTCSACGRVAQGMALGTRTFHCGGCGLVRDRDCNAAANLAALAEAATFEVAQVPDRQAAGSLMPLPVQCAFVSACWLVPLLGVPLLSRGWGWVLASSAPATRGWSCGASHAHACA